MVDVPLTRDALFERLRATFPALHWGASEEGGWNSGYLIHVEPDGDAEDEADTLRAADTDAPRSEITRLVAAAGWRIHRYDDEGGLYFLAPADDEAPALE